MVVDPMVNGIKSFAIAISKKNLDAILRRLTTMHQTILRVLITTISVMLVERPLCEDPCVKTLVNCTAS